MGVSVIGFAWEDGAVAKEFCSKFYPISIINKESILEICINEKIDGILTIASDVAVTTVNFVASAMGLIGNSTQSALYATNKYLMRQKLQAARVNCPKYYAVHQTTNIENLSNSISYPAIVKPVDRSGSKGVTKIHSPHELQKASQIAIEASFAKMAIVEEFIDGIEVSVEMISYEGKHYNLAITDKTTSGAPHFVELAHHQPSSLSPIIQNQIYESAHKGLGALEIKYGASHPEFIISDSGIYITEIGARMGGDFIGSDLVYLSTGYDFLKGVILVALGEFDPPVINLNKFSGVYFYSILSQSIGNMIDNKEKYNFIIRCEKEEKPLMPLKQSADRAGYFIYQNDEKIFL